MKLAFDITAYVGKDMSAHTEEATLAFGCFATEQEAIAVIRAFVKTYPFTVPTRYHTPKFVESLQTTWANVGLGLKDAGFNLKRSLGSTSTIGIPGAAITVRRVAV